MSKSSKSIFSQMGMDYYFDSRTPVANAVPIEYDMANDDDFAEILHILGDDVMDDSPIAYPVASATTYDSTPAAAHCVTAFPCLDEEAKAGDFDGYDPERIESMDLDELQNMLYLQDIVEDDEERKLNDEELIQSIPTSLPNSFHNISSFPPPIHVQPMNEEMEVDNTATAPPWERDEDLYSQSGMQSMVPLYDRRSQPPVSQRSFHGIIKEENGSEGGGGGGFKSKPVKKGPAKTKEPPSSNSSATLSRRQSATARREREQGRFKKATCNWVSVTDLFDQ